MRTSKTCPLRSGDSDYYRLLQMIYDLFKYSR